MDASLKPDPSRKGSYYRRIEDVERALARIESDKLSETMQFLVYYFSCEKIARGVVGLHLQRPALDAYRHTTKFRLAEVKAGSAALNLSVSAADLDWLFADFNEQHLLCSPNADWTTSARHLRNKLGHDFGPSNVARIEKHAPFHNPRMKLFLGCVPEILAYQRAHFVGVQ